MASNTAAAHGAHDAQEHHPTGWRRFVYSTNHKDIGTMYLVFALVAGVIGALMSVAIRMGNNPWGVGATTLDPPPFHQFETLPRIK